MQLKVCTKCNNEKHISRFLLDARYRDGYRNQCLDCLAGYMRKRRAVDPYTYKAKKFHTTPTRIKELLDTHKECQICGISTRRLVIDHDHQTMLIRGVLCHMCNTSIGAMNDDPMILRRAVAYLEDSVSG